MKISIFASIGAQNLWDELILKNEIELLKWEFWDESMFQVASYDAKNPLFQIANTSYFEYFPLGIKQIKNIFRNIRNFFKFLSVITWSDRVIIWGGGIIYDSELQSVWDPLNQWLFRARVARLFRKKLYFYAIGVDIKNLENNITLKKIFKNAWKITVRDSKSQQQLSELWIKSELVDDPVMREAWEKWDILGIHKSKSFKLKEFENYDFQWKKVWLALRSWYIWTSGDPRIEKLLVEELCSFIEKKWGKVVFIPHSLHLSDKQANDHEFMQQFLNYDREIYADLWEVYTVYNHKMIDLVISMRLHSIILSYVYGIDQIVLSYSKKTDEVIKKLTR